MMLLVSTKELKTSGWLQHQGHLTVSQMFSVWNSRNFPCQKEKLSPCRHSHSNLVDHDGARSWCKHEQICEQMKGKFWANETLISVPFGWNGKSGVPLRLSICSRKFPFELCIPFAFQMVGPEILAKRRGKPQKSWFIHSCVVKFGKSDWMTIQNKYSVHAWIWPVRSQYLVLHKRIVGSGGENGKLHSTISLIEQAIWVIIGRMQIHLTLLPENLG